MKEASKKRLKIYLLYIIDVILCLIILIWVLKLWKANFSIPFMYYSDGLYNLFLIKGMIESGTYIYNKFVGMPYGIVMYDFAASDSLHFLFLKFISLLHPNYAWTENIYYLITFPLTTILSLYVLRKLRLSDGSAMVGSLLYTFLPYHFLQGEGHLFLAGYYIIPLIVLVILWVYIEDDPLLFKYDRDKKKYRIDLSWKSLACIIISIITACSGLYYAFFACFFLVILGILAYLHYKDRYRLLSCAILLTVILFSVFCNLAPSILYQYKYGKNTETAQRSPIESEIFGLKISQMLLPVTGHRIPILANLKNKYNLSAPLVNENDTSSLGFFGSIGFLFLILWLFYKVYNKDQTYYKKFELLDALSILNLSAVLYGTIGGFGLLFNFIVSPEIRTLTRISVYIAFFSIISLFTLIEILYNKYNKLINWKGYFILILLFILLVGILDQTNSSMIPAYNNIATEFNSDDHFVRSIESVMPANAMIFQLPYVPFPENPPVNKMVDYDLLKGYLHSKNLRWSYPSMKGRYAAQWQQEISQLPMDEMVQALSIAGFSGIYLDSYGYTDMGISLETKLRELLNTQPIISDNKRLLFFNMINYNKLIREKYTDEELTLQQDEYLHPLLLTWNNGFSVLEGSADNNWRWCSSNGELFIDNPSTKTKMISMQMSFKTGHDNYSNLLIESPLLQEQIIINDIGSSFTKNIIIPSGENIIKFYCDAPIVNTLNDPRNLVFSVNNFKISAEGDPFILQN